MNARLDALDWVVAGAGAISLYVLASMYLRRPQPAEAPAAEE